MPQLNQTVKASRQPSAKELKVVSVVCYAITLPVATESYTMSKGRHLREFETTVVRVQANDGTTGWGEVCTLGDNYIEAFPGSVHATVHRLAKTVFDAPVLHPDVLDRMMDQALRGHRAGKAALDAAMWDLRGKVLGVPVALLLGGSQQASCPVFYPLTLASPDDMADEAKRIATEGYRRWQLKIGEDPIVDARRVGAVLDAVKGKNDFLTSDANGGWTMAQARTFLNHLSGAQTYIEQPCGSLRELAGLRGATPLPVIADEAIIDLNDLVSCVEQNAADAINIKPTRVGGYTKAAKLRDLAQALGLMLVIDEPMGADLASTSVCHLAASCRPESFLACSYLAVFSAAQLLSRGGAELRDGSVALPSGPGWGVEVNTDMLGKPLFELSAPR